MTNIRSFIHTGLGLCLVLLTCPVTAGAQQEGMGNPLTSGPVIDAPFSADATTTIQQTLGDGTRIDRRATAHYYRDRAGRVRVEQMIMGIASLSPTAEGQVRITIQPEPTDGRVYTLDPSARTARLGPRSSADWAVGGGETFAVPLGGIRFLVFGRGQQLRQRIGVTGNPVEEEALGTRQISGVDAVGRRSTLTIPIGQFGNDRPMEIVDERWESPQLRVVIYSRHSDPRTGVIDYRLTNIRRNEPPADLFVLPADYTVAAATGDWIALEFADQPKAPAAKREP